MRSRSLSAPLTGGGVERRKKREMTRQLDNSSIKAGQRKPGWETISKLSTRGTKGEDKSRSGTHTHTVLVCNILESCEWSKHTPALTSLHRVGKLLAAQLHQASEREATNTDGQKRQRSWKTKWFGMCKWQSAKIPTKRTCPSAS